MNRYKRVNLIPGRTNGCSYTEHPATTWARITQPLRNHRAKPTQPPQGTQA